MFGIPDISVSLAYLILLISTAGCVVYGVFFWNRGTDPGAEELLQEQTWFEEERKLDSEISGEDL